MNTYESRRFTRVPVSQPAVVTLPGGETFDVEIRDISATGLYAHSLRDVALRTECQVNFEYEATKPVEVRGVVVRTDRVGFGIEFTAVKGDTIDNLRLFILNHADDAHSTDIEFVSKLADLPTLY